MIIGESCSRLLHCVEPRGRLCGGGSLQKSLRHTWCLQIERWLLRLAGSSRPGTEDASHSSRMRFLRFWALFGAWRTIDFEKTRGSLSKSSPAFQVRRLFFAANRGANGTNNASQAQTPQRRRRGAVAVHRMELGGHCSSYAKLLETVSALTTEPLDLFYVDSEGDTM